MGGSSRRKRIVRKRPPSKKAPLAASPGHNGYASHDELDALHDRFEQFDAGAEATRDQIRDFGKQLGFLRTVVQAIADWQRMAAPILQRLLEFVEGESDEVILKLSDEQEARRLQLHDDPRLRKRLQKRGGIEEQVDDDAEDGYRPILDLRDHVVNTKSFPPQARDLIDD